MTDNLVISLAAMLATTSVAFAGGEGEDKKGGKPNSKTLRTLASTEAPQQGALLTAEAGKGVTIAVGDSFSLDLDNRVQILWRYANLENAQDTNNIDALRARTRLSGHVWEDAMTYALELDWAPSNGIVPGSGTNLKDAWFRWGFWESEDGHGEIGVRIGVQKPHHGREFQGSSEFLEHTTRSIASRVFSGLRMASVMLDGHYLEGNKLHWQVGFGNSDIAGASTAWDGRGLTGVGGDGAANVDNEVNFVFNVRFDPWGDMGDESYQQGDLQQTEELKGSVGAGVLIGNHRAGGTASPGTTDVETVSININTAWKYQGFHGLAEVFIRSDDPDAATASESDHVGWTIGGSYTLPKAETGPQWAGALRLGMVSNDDTLSPLIMLPGIPTVGGNNGGDITEINGTVSAYYHEHKLKTQVGYTFQSVDPDAAGSMDSDNHLLDVMFQWVF